MSPPRPAPYVWPMPYHRTMAEVLLAEAAQRRADHARTYKGKRA